MSRHIRRVSPLPLFALAVVLAGPGEVRAQTTAIVGATLIDGNGGAPMADATVVVEGDRITAVGPRAEVEVPPGAQVIDGAGKFITPGFVDTNVHISLYGGGNKDRKESSVFYRTMGPELTLEAAQMHLKFGVTHLRDSYGALPELQQVRDAIASGEAMGPRLQVAGNIVGWGGPYSITFALIPEDDLSLYEEQFSDHIAQGAGEDLMDLYPEELRTRIREYLDKGVDFLKYGGTSHWSFPTLIGFSPEAQRVIVEETHARGLIAETHSTNPEGLRLSVEAGIDLIQHPEVLASREISDALVKQIVDRGIVCSMLVNTFTGPAWENHLTNRKAAEERLAREAEGARAREWGRLRRPVEREKTTYQIRREQRAVGHGNEVRRLNAKKLIDGGCITSLGTDNYAGVAPEYGRTPKPIWQEPGIGTLLAIEGLVEMGMTPGDAIVAGTRNGAIAAGALDEFGTIEAGKLADLLVLDADPLADITNIRKQSVIMAAGRIIDADALPTEPVYFKR
ncbi:amidohydrolase family protein [Candidatus Palauibacter sp.]|uniref:amidohydrolase family protein n=1 Tax=Candidatus Palauibacter sp. TaxID=3101350 RepID=UPI003CC6289D